MPITKLYIPAALLLLVLSCPLWHVGQSLPMMGKGPVTDSCVSHARTLLLNITDVLAQDLFNGTECSKRGVELNMATDTPSVCAPKGSTCTGTTKAEFDQKSCLENIGEDLRHYYKFLAAHPKGLLELTVQLRVLMENCFPWSLSTDLASKQAPTDSPSTFDERLSLCKVLKGFHVRTITINRALGYMNSGEHTK
ncbi:interleukin-12 subunit alpha [Limanda limanda]|uniref:interleukin-12 subunit alpha n=1 Tax=Limanda limanda TaxID=27771 RepID=UPI0029C7E742|nr:interleukin-12 subunit alpha [Limanda limanda]